MLKRVFYMMTLLTLVEPSTCPEIMIFTLKEPTNLTEHLFIFFEHIQPHIKSRPDKFSIISKVVFEGVKRTTYTKEIGWITLVEIIGQKNNRQVHFFSEVAPAVNRFGFQGLPGVNMQLTYFDKENLVFRDSFYLALDFEKTGINEKGDAAYRVKTLFYNKDVQDAQGEYTQYTVQEISVTHLDLIQNFTSRYYMLNKIYDNLWTIKYSDITITPGKLSNEIITPEYGDFQGVLYQLIFYQEPAESDFFYDYSQFVNAPSFNGDFISQEGRLLSFYSSAVKETFWAGLSKNGANFVSLPNELISSSEKRQIEIKLKVDALLYGGEPQVEDLLGFPLITFEDNTGIKLLQFKHFLKKTNFIQNVKYEYGLQFVYKDSEQIVSKDFVNNDFSLLTKLILKIQLTKNPLNKVKIKFFCLVNFEEEHLIGEIQTDIYLSDLEIIYLGPRTAPFGKNDVAYLFKSLHVLSGVFHRGDPAHPQLDFGYSNTKFAPILSRSSDLNNSNLWIPTGSMQQRLHQKIFETKATPEIYINETACSENCEVCFNQSKCFVCVIGYVLAHDNCVKHESSLGVYFNSARQVLKVDSSSNLFGNDNLNNISAGKSTFDFVSFKLFFENTFTNTTPVDEYQCSVNVNNSETIQTQVKWNFLGYPFSFNSISTSDPFQAQVIKPNDSSFNSISTDHCGLSSTEVTHFTPDCTNIFRFKSLKGALFSRFCDNIYIDITNNPQMVYANYNVPSNGHYFQIPIPGTSTILYGKCRNNCKCWDPSLPKEMGYNSCLIDPAFGSKCAPGYRIRKYDFNDLYQECVPDWFCPDECLSCDSNGKCLSCEDAKFDSNFLSVFNDHLFCKDCSPGCFSCSGSNQLQCNCHQDQFRGTAVYDSEFRLCLSGFTCTANCVDCNTNGVCSKCKDKFQMTSSGKCKINNPKQCTVFERNDESICLDCSEGFFLNDQKHCVKCPSNCLQCRDHSDCFLCRNKYTLIKGKCINYSPFLGKLIDREKVSFDSADISIHNEVGYRKIFFYSAFDFILEYKVLNNLKSSKMVFDSEVNYSNYLESHSIKTCDLMEDKHQRFVCELAKKRIYLTNSGRVNSFAEKVNFINKNCRISKRPNICSECADYHYLESDKCSLINNSTISRVSFNQIKKKYQAAECTKSYYLKFPMKKCLENIYNCSLMSSTGKCLKCRENYTLSQDQLHCFTCPSNCLDCVSPTFCSTCQKGYYLNADKSKIVYDNISNFFQP
jgi:hypothetical protein